MEKQLTGMDRLYAVVKRAAALQQRRPADVLSDLSGLLEQWLAENPGAPLPDVNSDVEVRQAVERSPYPTPDATLAALYGPHVHNVYPGPRAELTRRSDGSFVAYDSAGPPPQDVVPLPVKVRCVCGHVAAAHCRTDKACAAPGCACKTFSSPPRSGPERGAAERFSLLAWIAREGIRPDQVEQMMSDLIDRQSSSGV